MRVRTVVVWLIAGLVLAAHPSPAAALSEEEQATLSFVRAAHKSSRDAIRTASCRVNYEVEFYYPGKSEPVRQTCSSNYWFSHSAIRVQATDSSEGFDSDYVWKDSTRTSMVKRPSGEVAATLSLHSDRFLHRCDAWSRALFALDVPGTVRNVLFEEMVNCAARVERVQRTRNNGEEVILVRLFFEKGNERNFDWTTEIFLCSRVNYLVTKIVHQRKTDGYTRITEVADFKEIEPGVFFPEQVVSKTTGDSYRYSAVAEFSDVRVNQPLPPDTFELRFPPGIIMSDAIRNTYYRIDEAGNRISEEKPTGRGGAPPPLLAKAASAGNAPMSRTVTLKEPPSATRWILPVSIGILALAAIGYLIRRWRSGAVAE